MTSQFWSNIVRGVALGDSYGDLHEFASIESITRDNPRGPEIPAHLRITDDTQMTLYLGAALDESWDKDMDIVKRAIMDRFLDYNVDPDNNRAPGCTVTGSLNALARANYNWKSATSHHSDGSGTVMRTSPCAFLPEDRWVGVTAFAAAVTHGTPNAIAAAILNVAILRALMRGETTPGNLRQYAIKFCTQRQGDFALVDEWLEGLLTPVQLISGFQELVRLLTEIGNELYLAQQDPWALKSDPSHWAKMGGGWRAHETLVIALAALDMFPTDPMNALRRAVVTDGDSDTIGAVAGGLIGAAYPSLFTDMWNEGLRDRFEPRYVRWIEGEADTYPFSDPAQPIKQAQVHQPRKSLFWRLVRF